ncbi:MAG TPA: hypothetical protein VNK67_07620 [Burkholderiales bacterium]|nr:hypothetical protein [Burkholderiales bacterium]
MRIALSLALALAAAGCAQLPPGPQDARAKRFEPLPDKAVIYIVREIPELNGLHATLVLDDRVAVPTYTGTFYRWETAPGRRRIAGFAADGAAITIHAEPGKLYFVQQIMLPGASSAQSLLQLVDERYGRALVLRGAGEILATP